MLTAAQQREDAIYRLTDVLALQLGWEGPFRVHHEEDLLLMAEQSVDAAARGEVHTYQFLVIPYQSDSGWTYRAMDPNDDEFSHGVYGCPHEVHAATRHLGCAAAVAEHRQHHMGDQLT